MAFQTPEVFPATGSFPAVASFPSTASFPSAYDPDAVSCFTASGVTDPTQKLNISQFFTGLKKNNLWNILIEGWSGRSDQNVGTGTTTYGLKGFKNGTLVNGPTWGVDGLGFSGSTQRMTVSSVFPETGNVQRAMVFIARADAGTQDTAVGGTVDFGDARFSLRLRGSSAQGVMVDTFQTAPAASGPSIAAISSTGFHTSMSDYNGASTCRVKYDGSEASATAALSFSLVNFQLNGLTAGGTNAGAYTIALALTFKSSIWGSRETLRTLIKNTIGQGLGLP